jgi:hypothetical protein
MTSLFIGEKTFLANIKSRLQKETGINVRSIMIYYRVDFARSGGKYSIEGDVMKISRLYKESGQDKTLESREPFEGVYID